MSAGAREQRGKGAGETRGQGDKETRRVEVSLSPRLPRSLSQLWALVSLASIFVILGLWLIRPHDFWWHVRLGQWIVEHGRLPNTDFFSFTQAGQPWVCQSWLMEVVLYLLLRLGDLPLVIFCHAVLITASYGLLLWLNRQAGGDWRRAALATLAAATTGVANWNVRPQTISFLLFALTLYLIGTSGVRHLQGTTPNPEHRKLWWLPPLFALWANAHGGFIFGLALLGTALLARLWAWLRREERFPTQVLLVTGFSAAATLLTPLGPGMVEYVLGFFRHPVTRTQNMEFLPPTIRTLDGQLFFCFLAVWIALLLVSRYRPTRGESLRLLLFGGLALMSRRNTAWFGLVAAPTLAASLHCWAVHRGVPGKERVGHPGLNRTLAVLVGLATLLSLPWFRPYLPLPEWRRAYVSPETPVEAVAFLRSLPQPRRVFHDQGYGSYMIWASPEIPVFIDTRIELYPPAQWDDYIALSQARYDWLAILDRYGIDTLLLQRESQQPLIEAATASPDWERCYEDEQTVIFQREP
ncbi:MAG: hypothetical protein QHJ81_03125 [Anaerolineae bacterium]|nr:hypothetical protein [Anaerolineae bacterium]